MKANRKFVNGDEAVSPVIAVILMVAITVVLAATVYLWVSGFGSNQSSLVQASFASKAVDLPGSGGDTDGSDDTIQITFASGQKDVQMKDITVSIDGVLLNATSTGYFTQGGTFAAGNWCTTVPGGAASATEWKRGASVYLYKAASSGVSGCVAAMSANAQMQSIRGVHQLSVSVLGQVVLDTTIEVHDAIN
jgi:archaeal type IV pilus assembly protein PilA